MICSAVQKLLSLIKSHLFIFIFASFALGNRSKKVVATVYVRECSAHIVLQEFYDVHSYVYIFNSF